VFSQYSVGSEIAHLLSEQYTVTITLAHLRQFRP